MAAARRDHGELIDRLVPILVVRDLEAERAFYEALGLRVTYEGPEYPDFIGMGNDAVEFGLERPDGAAATADDEPARKRVLTWQLGVSNIDAAVARCQAAGLEFSIEVHEPRPDWRYRTLKLRSPSGFDVVLEGPSESE